ncbi:MAG: sulfatase-like hydrolase/transferase [Chloroflexota bacterium]
MNRRPNVLWLISDQHNANCTGYAGHPNVKTPNLDRIASGGVTFTSAFANCPMCSPSRISFMTGQYVHTHRMFSNANSEYPTPNPDMLPALFRRYGYQTALVGKSHMVRRWDADGFEVIRYCDLNDALRGDPFTCHYFRYLDDRGLADYYEGGSGGMSKKGQESFVDGATPSVLPYEHSVEHWTGNETLEFLRSRDTSRPFFVTMSFERPHAPILPAPEFFNMYDPEEVVLPDSAFDYLESGYAWWPEFMRQELSKSEGYRQTAILDLKWIRRRMASYYALITTIDLEIGRVLDKLNEMGELENTIILYHSDHGDFAAEHGLVDKGLGMYESIHRVPFLLSWPGGPEDAVCDEIVELVDCYTTLCALCDVPEPEGREGIDLVPVAMGEKPGKEAAFCELGPSTSKSSAIRTRDLRLVYYSGMNEGELYDHRTDPGETKNLWNDPAYTETRLHLLERLMSFSLQYSVESGGKDELPKFQQWKYSPTELLRWRYWSVLKEAYGCENEWPPDPPADRPPPAGC